MTEQFAMKKQRLLEKINIREMLYDIRQLFDEKYDRIKEIYKNHVPGDIKCKFYEVKGKIKKVLKKVKLGSRWVENQDRFIQNQIEKSKITSRYGMSSSNGTGDFNFLNGEGNLENFSIALRKEAENFAPRSDERLSRLCLADMVDTAGSITRSVRGKYRLDMNTLSLESDSGELYLDGSVFKL